MSDPSTEVKPLKHAEDLDLVDRAVNGDEDAVLAFQTEYQPMLERVMMSRESTGCRLRISLRM